MKHKPRTTSHSPKGLSLVELLIAIGILGVTMVLIAAAFPAGVAMSIAVSDETTAGAVFQEALSVIRDNYSISKITAEPGGGVLPSSTYAVIPNAYLSWDDSSSSYDAATGFENREYEIAGQSTAFSWSALIRLADPTATAGVGPMGNLCHVIVIVSRQPTGNPNFLDEATGADSNIPELRTVDCTGVLGERTLTVTSNFGRIPSAGYIIDSDTGTTYSMISRNPGGTDDTVTLLTSLPADITSPGRNFWLIPGPYDGSTYGRVSPAIRVFQTTLYLP